MAFQILHNTCKGIYNLLSFSICYYLIVPKYICCARNKYFRYTLSRNCFLWCLPCWQNISLIPVRIRVSTLQYILLGYISADSKYTIIFLSHNIYLEPTFLHRSNNVWYGLLSENSKTHNLVSWIDCWLPDHSWITLYQGIYK